MQSPLGKTCGVMLAGLWCTQALGAAITVGGVNNGFNTSLPVVLGYEFTVEGTPITVTDLGVFDFGLLGLGASHQVGVWTLDDLTPLVSATVPSGSGTTLEGFFRYVDIPDTGLSANTTYVIGATWGIVDKFVWDKEIAQQPGNSVTGFSVDPLISLGAAGTARTALGSALVRPHRTDTSLGKTPALERAAIFGPNLWVKIWN